MTSSIQVSEEMIAAGIEACSSPWLNDAELVTNIYLAMRSKDHSIAVDDVREAAKALLIRCDNHARDICEPLFWKEREALRTAIGSQSIEGERANDLNRNYRWR